MTIKIRKNYHGTVGYLQSMKENIENFENGVFNYDEFLSTMIFSINLSIAEKQMREKIMENEK